MPYELDPEQPIGRELARVIAEQMDVIGGTLGASDDSPIGSRIHRARVALKRVRAALSLAKPQLPEFYKRQNAICRDAGRKLSRWRDAEVRVETFDKLQQKFGTELAGAPVQPIRKALLSRRKLARANEPTLPGVAAELNRARKALSKLDAVEDVLPAILKVYRRGRNAFQNAYGAPAPAAFHEWRKAVKRHLYHIELMEKALPEFSNGYRKKLKKLADLLGDDHNLAVLQDNLPRSAAPVSRIIEQWQAELRAEAADLGNRIYDEKPRHFSKRVEGAWRRAA